ncbi:hypothetical protein Lser_V15G15145 [Lactuca serriola]
MNKQELQKTTIRCALEEIKFLQKLRERKSGVPAIAQTGQVAAVSGVNNAGGLVPKGGDKGEADGEKDDLVLQDTFAQKTDVMDEDPHICYKCITTKYFATNL